jgi:nicotinamide riboside transporter PnuC
VFDLISQIAIAVLGVLSIFLIAKKKRIGFICGLVVQPFYFYTSLQNHQWGLFIATFFYTGSWIYGAYQWYFRNGGDNGA